MKILLYIFLILSSLQLILNNDFNLNWDYIKSLLNLNNDKIRNDLTHKIRIFINSSHIESRQYDIIKKDIKEAKDLISNFVYINTVQLKNQHIFEKKVPMAEDCFTYNYYNESIYDYYDMYILLLNNNITKDYLREEKCSVEKGFTRYGILYINFNSQLFFRNQFKIKFLRYITKFLGFNSKTLKNYKIKNNFQLLPSYVIGERHFVKSCQKFYRLTNRSEYDKKILISDDSYKTHWGNFNELNDYMSFIFDSYSTMTEVTSNLLNDIPYLTTDKCDVELYNNIFCPRFDNKCFNTSSLNNYFIKFYEDKLSNKIKCYLNTQDNLAKKQCGIITGNLYYESIEVFFNVTPSYKKDKISSNNAVSKYDVPELDYIKSQEFYFVIPHKLCPKKHPRTIYFRPLHERVEPFDYQNFKFEIKNDTIHEKKYYVTYYYSRGEFNVFKTLKPVFKSYNKYGDNNLIIHGFVGEISQYNNPYVFNKHQKFGRFPTQVSKKVPLIENYKILQSKFPKDFNFMPESYIYPKEKDIIKNKFKNYKLDLNDLWLCKPSGGLGGEGIYFLSNTNSLSGDLVVSKYILKPHLIKGHKYDIRFFALVSNVSPLRIYFFTEGLVKISPTIYNVSFSSLDDKSMHYTNVHLNEKNENFRNPKDENDLDSNTWTFAMYKKYLESLGFDYNKIMTKAKDAIIKTVISLIHIYVERIKELQHSYYNYFSILGFDILYSENMEQIYVLEVNRDPSFNVNKVLNRGCYNNLISDTLNIVGIYPYSHDKDAKPMDEVYKYNDEIEEAVDDAICEFMRPMGKYERIFPKVDNIDEYQKYFLELDKTPENEALWKRMKEMKNLIN